MFSRTDRFRWKPLVQSYETRLLVLNLQNLPVLFHFETPLVPLSSFFFFNFPSLHKTFQIQAFLVCGHREWRTLPSKSSLLHDMSIRTRYHNELEVGRAEYAG